jgi:sulfur transfer protein SufE
MQKVEEREKTHLNTLRTLFPTMVLAPASMDSEEDVVCSVCHQFCFFSYLSCPCDEAPIRCLAHYDGVCNGSEQHDPVLYNRSPLSKLRYLIDRVNKVASKPAEWLSRARALLRDNQRPQLRALQQLYEAAEKLPSIPVQAESLHEYLVVAEAWLDRATKVLDAGKRRLKKLAMDIDEDHRSTISEVQSLLAEADTVGLETPEIKALGSILDHALDYQERARGVLALSLEGDEARKNANDLLDLGATLEVHVEEFDILEKRLAELEWWQNASLLVDKTFVEYDDVCDMAEDGRDIGIKSDEPLFARLRKMRSAGDQWRIDALRVVKSKSISMDELRGLDARTEKTPSIKELREKIRQLISKVDDWRNRARSLLAAANVELPPMDEEVIIKKKSRSKGFSRADSEPDDDEGDQMSPKTGAEGDVKEATWLKKTDEAGTLPAPSESPDASVTPTKRVLLAGETRSLVSELDNCPVKPVEIAVFKEELRQVEDWVSRAKKVFARRDKTLKESLDEIQTNLVNGVGSGEGLFCLCRTADEGFMVSLERRFDLADSC